MQLAWLNIFHYTYYNNNMLSPLSNFSLLCAPCYVLNLVTVCRLQHANMYVDVDFQKCVINVTTVVHENHCLPTVKRCNILQLMII